MSRSATNGPSDQVTDDELRRRVELKDEEVMLYKNKYEECSKQLLQAVRKWSFCVFKICFINSSLFSNTLLDLSSVLLRVYYGCHYYKTHLGHMAS